MEGELPSVLGDERLGTTADDYRPDELTDWDYVRETLRLMAERDGMPSRLDDLSVDGFTERRLRGSDFAGIVKIWRKPSGPRFHPAIKDQIAAALAGRDPEIYVDSDPLVIYLNVEDDSFETRFAVELFGGRLALILDGLPRVVVGRYRNFDTEDKVAPPKVEEWIVEPLNDDEDDEESDGPPSE